jgi:hypothetical protein
VIHYVTDHVDDRIMAYPSRWEEEGRKRMRFVRYRDLPEIGALAPGSWIFADLESLGPAHLEIARRSCERLRAAPSGFRVLNSPERVLYRLGLLEKLYEAGINDFRAYRAEGLAVAAPRFPVFVRRADDHKGTLTPLLEGPRQLARALRYLRLQGHRPSDLLVVEFCDTRGEDGLYRKYAAFIVGGTILPRHLLFSRRWMLKRPDLAAPELEAEAEAYLTGNPHEEPLRRIFALAGIEYGRIDYGLRKGRLQVWEINTHPTVTSPTFWLTRAFEEIDVEERGTAPVAVSFPPELVARARRERAKSERRGLRREGIDRLARSALAKPLTRSLRALMGQAPE